jgi:hypothetical protein
MHSMIDEQQICIATGTLLIFRSANRGGTIAASPSLRLLIPVAIGRSAAPKL